MSMVLVTDTATNDDAAADDDHKEKDNFISPVTYLLSIIMFVGSSEFFD